MKILAGIVVAVGLGICVLIIWVNQHIHRLDTDDIDWEQ